MNPKLFYPLVWAKSKLKIDCSLRGRHTTWSWRICTLATFQGALIEICTPAAGSSEVISLWKQRDVCQLVRNMADGCLTGVWTRGCRKWTDWRVPFIQTSPIHYSSLAKHGQPGQSFECTQTFLSAVQAESPRLDRKCCRFYFMFYGTFANRNKLCDILAAVVCN